MEGTQQEAWLGIPASGKRVAIRMSTVHRVEQGRIVEDWVLVEFLGLFQQLGVLPDIAELIGSFSKREDDSPHFEHRMAD
jgi:hypothetical protein